VDIFDVAGRRVRELVDDMDAPAGAHQVRFDGRSSNGQRLGAGVYFYRIDAGEGMSRGRLVILK
jgi:hypothetical protein